MKKITIYKILFMSLLFYTNVYATSFINGFEDIPLMKGLTQISDNDISFGNEETRFIETQLQSSKNIKFNDIKNFYIKALAQFGWNLKEKSESNVIFYRENDVLEINKIASNPLKISINIKNMN